MNESAHPVSYSETVFEELTTMENSNRDGTFHGGALLKMVDRVAAVCAIRHSGSTCVTVAVEKVEFHTPIYIGNVVTYRAHVNHVGNSSMEIGIEVTAENPISREQTHTNSCLVTMVAVDDQRNPIRVPRLTIENDAQQKRWDAAVDRRKNR